MLRVQHIELSHVMNSQYALAIVIALLLSLSWLISIAILSPCYFQFFVVYSSWYLNAYRLNLHLAWSGETSDDYWLCVYFAMQILFGAILCQHGHNSLKQWNSNIAAVHKNLLKMIIIPPKIHRTKKNNSGGLSSNINHLGDKLWELKIWFRVKLIQC